jgi:hypothetical protein
VRTRFLFVIGQDVPNILRHQTMKSDAQTTS